MLLQNLVFPKIGVCTEEKLYFKKHKHESYYDYKAKKLVVSPGDIVRFDTYFNSFLADRWSKYTDIKNCRLFFKGSGKGQLRIYRESSFNGKELIFFQEINLTQEGEAFSICNTVKDMYGIIYCEYQAYDESSIYEGNIFTDTDCINEISLGIVITTFKREEYINRNMKLLKEHLFNVIDDKRLHIFIIDNGQSLTEINDERITVIPNKNYGGAGGFGRGMLEIYSNTEYNHVVFCDDDAVYEPEAFLRLFNFLSYAKDPKVCIGGSMLKLDDPKYMYESGAIYSALEGRPNKNMLDMTKFDSLIEFASEEYATYHAWWFFVCPISCVKELGLPIPVFFQLDDVEYSLRLRENNYTTIDLNGICVWHESFQRKSSTATNYYWVRNEVVVSAIHDDLSAMTYLKWFNKYFIQSLFVYRYDRAEMMLHGMKDALKGPKFLMAIDPSVYHKDVLKRQIDKPHAINKKQVILSKYNRPVRNDWLKKALMFVTMNGMILPKLLRDTGKNITDKGYVIEPLQGFRSSANFRKEIVLYVDPERMMGFEVHRNPAQFWKLIFKMIKIDFQILLSIKHLKNSYRESFPKMKSLDFWNKYLGI